MTQLIKAKIISKKEIRKKIIQSGGPQKWPGTAILITDTEDLGEVIKDGMTLYGVHKIIQPIISINVPY